MKGMAMYAGWLVVLGALVVGVEGLAQMNVLDSVLGAGSVLERAVQVVIGLAGVMLAVKMLSGKSK